jgi:hypothetical protein
MDVVLLGPCTHIFFTCEGLSGPLVLYLFGDDNYGPCSERAPQTVTRLGQSEAGSTLSFPLV